MGLQGSLALSLCFYNAKLIQNVFICNSGHPKVIDKNQDIQELTMKTGRPGLEASG